MEMLAPRGLSAVRFVFIGDPKKLGQLARELAAYRLGDPHNTRVERLGSLGAIIVGRAKFVVVLFLRHDRKTFWPNAPEGELALKISVVNRLVENT
jgi:hypothetical protein